MRAPWQAGRLVALDFETTGLSSDDDVVSYGLIPIERGRVDVGAGIHRLVRPGRPMRPETVAVHRIRPLDVATAPAVIDIATELRNGLGDHPIVVWTAWVEAEFLAQSLGGSSRRWRRRMVDVRLLAIEAERRLGAPPQAAAAGLAATAQSFGIPPEQEHHALADAFVTAQLLVVLASRIGPSLSADELLRLGGGGRHRR